MTPSPEVKRRLLAEIAARPAPVRRQGRRRAVVSYALAIVAAFVVFEGAGGVSHSHGRPLALTLALGAGGALIALAATLLVARRQSMVGPSQSVLASVTIALPLVVFLWVGSFHGRYDEPSARVGWRCLALTLTCGGVLLAAVIHLRKRSAVRSEAWIGAGLGATMGAWGAALVDLWCPLTNASHVARGHVAPIVILGLVGAVYGRMMLALTHVRSHADGDAGPSRSLR
jgi:hypothetical protein